MTLTDVINALAACEQALDHPPDWTAACQKLGYVLQGAGRFEESSEWFSIALESEPDPAEMHAKLGRLYANHKSWQRAIAAFQRVLHLPGDHAGAYWHLGKIYDRLGQKQKAAKIYAKSAQLYASQEQWQQAILTYQQILCLPGDHAETYWHLLQLHTHLDHQEEALECQYQFLALRPAKASAEGHYQLGQQLLEQGNTEAAITCYQHSIKQDPRYWSAYYEVGDLLTTQGKWEQAIATYQSLLHQDPNQIKARFKLGLVWVKQHKDEQAIAKFREIVALAPDFPWAYLELIKILIRQERWDDAIGTCQAVIEFLQEFPWAYRHMANALIAKGEQTAAIACYQKACELEGWSICGEQGYQFTRDTFSHQIELWQTHLQSIVDSSGVQALEVGSFEGMTTCWLLDHILTDPLDRLTCIDSQFQEAFESNLRKTGAADRVTQLEGTSHPLMDTLKPDAYDLVSIQDRCKKADHLHQDAVLAWRLLKADGILLFKDYAWNCSKDPNQAPKIGIDQFLRTIKGQFNVLHRGYQLIIQKVAV